MTALRAFTVTALSLLFFVLAAPPMFQNFPTLYTGIHPLKTGALVQPFLVRVEPNSPAYRAGVRTGDVVGCISLRDQSLLVGGPVQAVVAYVPGTPISFCAKQAGAVHQIRFTAQPRPPPGYFYGSLGVAALRVAVFVIFLLCGIALVLGRPSVMTWLFFAYCLGSAPTVAMALNGTVWPPLLYAFALVLLSTANNLGVAFLLLFAIVVPDDRVPSNWRRFAFRIAVVVTLLLAAFSLFNNIETTLAFSPNLLNAIDEALTVVTVLVVLARLIAMQSEDRARFAWAAFAIIWGVVMNDLRNIQAFTDPALRPVGITAGILTCVMPLSLMYAILRRHIIDVRFVISRAVVYTVITTLVVGIIGAVDWATSVYLHQTRIAMALSALVTIGLGFVLHRTYGWLEEAVDVVLYRKKHEAEAYINRLARTLLRADREETVDRALVHDPYDKFDLTMAALFRSQGSAFIASCSAGSEAAGAIAFEREHDLVRFLLTERTRLHIGDLRRHVAAEFVDLGSTPAVAIPIFLGDDLAAFTVYGIHKDGTKLDPDEVDTLERLGDSAAQAYIRIENIRYRAFAQQPLPA